MKAQAMATSLLRFTFAGLVLASSSLPNVDTCALTTAIVTPLDSRATVESLIATANYLLDPEKNKEYYAEDAFKMGDPRRQQIGLG